ncbi:MAG: DUF5615 family PIN-like protein [bacterium]|nr:DUF5615 family PIN-like protein [bacterium]
MKKRKDGKKKKALKLLLDENFPDKKLLSRLNSRDSISIEQVRTKKGATPLSDRRVLERAIREERVVVTLDKKFAKPKNLSNKVGVIFLHNAKSLLPKELEDRLLLFFNKRPAYKLYGVYIRLYEKRVEILKP